eukprot:TRINITY_DN26209_c0_g2_i1.p1 TRINITY_DN26209_c0_g2~~TRINITY_DN26209_c0_g2_i1.p1  ORF type:complete len:230 (+),score=49.60 TRINITY_DN26209_c0_g2_i1:89-778(+)
MAPGVEGAALQHWLAGASGDAPETAGVLAESAPLQAHIAKGLCGHVDELSSGASATCSALALRRAPGHPRLASAFFSWFGFGGSSEPPAPKPRAGGARRHQRRPSPSPPSAPTRSPRRASAGASQRARPLSAEEEEYQRHRRAVAAHRRASAKASASAGGGTEAVASGAAAKKPSAGGRRVLKGSTCGFFPTVDSKKLVYQCCSAAGCVRSQPKMTYDYEAYRDAIFQS